MNLGWVRTLFILMEPVIFICSKAIFVLVNLSSVSFLSLFCFVGKKNMVKRRVFGSWVGKISWVGNSNPFQYSCLENYMDRGAWWAIVHGSQSAGHDWATERVHMHTITGWSRTFFMKTNSKPILLHIGWCQVTHFLSRSQFL